MSNPMTSSKPYILRAIYEWLVDNGLTPHILVDVDAGGAVVPKQYVKDGKIVLNISATACANLRIGNDAVECKVRFGGISHNLYVPIEAVLSIYARENNQGTTFQPSEPSSSQAPTKSSPKFTLVDGGKDKK